MSAPAKIVLMVVAWLWLASSGTVPGPAQVAAGGGVGTASGGYADEFNAAGARHGVDPALLSAIAHCESGYNPRAQSPAGARGLMQFMPDTARHYGVDPLDPGQAIDGAARYLADSIAHLGTRDPGLLAASYNAGRYGTAVEAGRIPNNGETPGYVRCVRGQL